MHTCIFFYLFWTHRYTNTDKLKSYPQKQDYDDDEDVENDDDDVGVGDEDAFVVKRHCGFNIQF